MEHTSATSAPQAQAAKPETAHGITRPGPAKMAGWHLSDAANEPNDFRQIEDAGNADARPILRGASEADLIAADLARNQGKAARLHDKNDLRAQRLQVNRQDSLSIACMGGAA